MARLSKDTFTKLSKKVKFTLDKNGKYYVVTDGCGGRRSVNLYLKYKEGIYGTHYAHYRVSGAFVKSFDDINDTLKRGTLESILTSLYANFMKVYPIPRQISHLLGLMLMAKLFTGMAQSLTLSPRMMMPSCF